MSLHVPRWSCLVVALACASGCAGAQLEDPGDDADAEAGAFRGLERLVVVRQLEGGREARPKDPLDAVAESLAADGRSARVVELPARRAEGEAAELARLRRQVEAAVLGTPRGGRPVVRLGAEAGRRVMAAGADAAVLLVRLDRPTFPPPLAPAGRLAEREPFGVRVGGAALALVDRAGRATWFAWGGPEPLPGEPFNAAEAVDALVRLLRGEPAPDGDEPALP